MSFPCSPNARSCPIDTPKPSASARASLGVCSMTELSSSPRRVPLANPCPNCINAAFMLSALPPLIAIAAPIDSVTFRILDWEMPSSFPARAMVEYVAPSSVKLDRVRCATLNRLSYAAAADWALSADSLRLVCSVVTLSAILISAVAAPTDTTPASAARSVSTPSAAPFALSPIALNPLPVLSDIPPAAPLRPFRLLSTLLMALAA